MDKIFSPYKDCIDHGKEWLKYVLSMSELR